MLISAARAVERHLPGTLGDQPSVACVWTSHPKALVFRRDASVPSFVVEFGDLNRLGGIHTVLGLLHPLMPESVSRSLVLQPWDDGRSVHIQEGMPGVPWFRIADTLKGAQDWNLLVTRTSAAGARLQQAARTIPQWVRPVYLADELAGLVSRLRGHHVPLSVSVIERCGRWQAEFRGQSIAGVAQHGDFSLNNLMVAEDRVVIIDFEEFGQTYVPLHDAFGLALSFRLSQDRCSLDMIQLVDLALGAWADPSGVGRGFWPALLMHHMLWRIERCVGIARRDRLQRILLAWADDLACSPGMFFRRP